MFMRAGLGLVMMMLPTPALAGSGLPEGFAYLRDIDPGTVQDIRYAGSKLCSGQHPVFCNKICRKQISAPELARSRNDPSAS
jgi:hypothetical protein